MTHTTATAAQPSLVQTPHLYIGLRRTGIVLYALTFLLEIPGAIARLALMSLVYWLLERAQSLIIASTELIGVFTRGSVADAPPPTSGLPGFLVSGMSSILGVWWLLMFLVTVAPLACSLLTFVLPGGWFLHKLHIGARNPSQREKDSFNTAFDTISAVVQKPLHWPGVYYVVDRLDQEATVIGSTLYITRGLVRSQDDLNALLAHSLSHLNSLDGRLVLALRRFVALPVYLLSRALGQTAPGVVQVGAAAGGMGGCLASSVVFVLSFLLALAGGGLGTLLLAIPWAWYWRQREFVADSFARDLGQQAALVQHLETYQGRDTVIPYMMGEVPSSEMRIDRLQHPENYTQADQFDLMPWLISALAVLVIFCGVPNTINAIARAQHNVTGDFVLSAACNFGDCDPAEDGRTYQDSVTNIQLRDGMVYITTSSWPDNTLTYVGEGTYNYIDNDTVFVQTTSSGQGYGPIVRLNGSYDIVRRGNVLELRGDTVGYAFVSSTDETRDTTDLGAAPVEADSTVQSGGLVGEWHRVTDTVSDQTITFNNDGTFRAGLTHYNFRATAPFWW